MDRQRSSKLLTRIGRLLFLSPILLGALLYSNREALEVQFKISQFVPAQDSRLVASDAIAEKYYLRDELPIVLLLEAAPGHRWTDPEASEFLREFTSSILRRDDVQRALSLTEIEGAIDRNGELEFGPYIELLSQDKEALGRVAEIPGSSFQNFLSKDLTSTALYVFPHDRSQSWIEEFQREIESATLDSPFLAGLQVGGLPAAQAEMVDLLKAELPRSFFWAVGFMLIIVSLVFATPSTTCLLLWLCFLSNSIAFLTLILLEIPLTVLGVTFPILFSTLVVTVGSHSVLRFIDESEYSDKLSAAWATARATFVPNLLAAFTTVVGYLTLLTADVPIIQDYALGVAVGVTASFLLTQLILPLWLLAAPLPRVRSWWSQLTWSNALYQRPRLISVLGIAVLLSLYIASPKLSWNGTIIDDLPNGKPARLASEAMDDKLSGFVSLDLNLTSTTLPWSTLGQIQAMEQLSSDLRQLAGIGRVQSLADVLNEAGGLNNPLPQTQEEIQELIYLLQFSGESPLRHFLANNSYSSRVSLFLHDLPADEMITLIARVEKLAAQAFPNTTIEMGGMAAYYHPANQSVSETLIFGFWIAMAAIALMLILIFRSFAWALLCIVPNLAPPVFLFFALGISGLSIEPGLAMVFCICLGFSFDNTVYIVDRLRKHSLGDGDHKSFLVEIIPESKAALLNQFVLVAGFMAFCLSSFSLNQQLGIFMILGLTVAALADCILLPNLYLGFMCKRSVDQEEKVMTDFGRKEISRIAASMLLSFTLILPAAYPEAKGGQVSADQILENINKRLQSKSEIGRLELTVIEADGTKKERSLTVKRIASDDSRVLVRINKPADMAGISFLSVAEAGQSDQWIYMPQTRKTRRVVNRQGKNQFLDSELSYEDFNFETYESFSNKVVGEKKVGSSDVIHIQSQAKAKGAPYSKIDTLVDKKSSLIREARYFDAHGKPLKRVSFNKYQKYGTETWRATEIVVQNLQNKRQTVLTLADLQLNTRFPASEVSVDALDDF